MLAFLRQLLRIYTWVEPEPFRRAEQFGLDDTRRCGGAAALQVQTNLMTPQAS